MANPIVDAIDNINSAFDEYKKVNDERLEAESKGHEARARELDEKLSRIEDAISEETKAKKIAERELEIQRERLEILEATSRTPGKSVEEKASKEHKNAFLDAFRSKFKDSEKNANMGKAWQKLNEVKTIQTGTAALGGHGVPEEISRQIEALMLKMSDIIPEVGITNVGTSDYKELISINSTTSAWAAELGTRSQQTDPNLRQVAPTIGELYTYLFASNEALEDIFFDVEGWLVNTAAESAAKALEAAVWNGNGTSKPTGMTNTAPVVTADTDSPLRAAAAYQYVPTDSASPQALGGDDVIDLAYSLNRAYRGNAKFAGNTNTHAAVRKLKDSQGQYLWQPSLQAGEPDTLLGYSFFTWEDMDDPTTADGHYLAFGDFSRAYTLIDRQGLAITTDDNITTPGTVKFYIRKRFGGIPANNDALKFLKLADT